MQHKTILVETSSWNLWWGIYGLSPKSSWEDIVLHFESGERIGGLCLNTKEYLKGAIDSLKESPEEKDYLDAIEKYLLDNKCYYWFFYDDEGEEDFHEVKYNAPTNEKGIKPRFTEIWHPNLEIDVSTIISGVKDFAKQFLNLEECEVKITTLVSFEDSLKSYKEEKGALLNLDLKNIVFGESVVEELSESWSLSKEKTLEKLYKSIK